VKSPTKIRPPRAENTARIYFAKHLEASIPWPPIHFTNHHAPFWPHSFLDRHFHSRCRGGRYTAFQRNEPINALWLVIAGVCTFAVAYRFYSAWLVAKVLTIDDMRAPAAVTCSDGKDFVPTPKWVVFGHHFAAIAGPGPLVGPVLAAQFGYLPGTLWILVGATLGGGVHDAVILFASMRRNGKSLGQMLKEELNPFIGLVAMISLLAIMTILLAVLGLVVVKALAESPWGLFTIAATIPLAFCLGTVILIKMGKARYCWVTVVPMIFLTAVTFTAGFMKNFSANAAGFFPAIRTLEAQIATGLEGAALKAATTSLLNARIDICITITFLAFVTIIVLGTARECWLILSKRKKIVLHESDYVLQRD